MTDVIVGHSLAMSLTFLDADGNPMLTQPTPDSVPVWTQTTPATESLAPAADGLSCVASTLAVGTDVVTVSPMVGGVSFPANLSVNVTAKPQVLTSARIDVVVN